MDIKVDHKTIIVFDLDDTLYNEIGYLKSAYLDIARNLDKEDWQRLYVKMFSLYRNKKDVFAFLHQQYNVAKSSLIMEYREHEPDIKLFDGVLDTLQKIKKNNGKIGLITDGRKSTQTNKIKALGLTPFLDGIVISQEIGTEKPHLNNYKMIESTFGKGTYYYIADNLKKDFITPKTLGWNTIGIMDNGLNIHNDAYLYQEEKYLPHAFISSFLDLTII